MPTTNLQASSQLSQETNGTDNSQITSDRSKKRRLDEDSLLNSPPAQVSSQRGLTTNNTYTDNTTLRRDFATQPSQSPESRRQASQIDDSALQSKLLFEARDISFQSPLRKKFHLGLTRTGCRFQLQLRNTSDSKVEVVYEIDSYAHFLVLPVPEKIQKQYNFCIMPQPGRDVEPLVWTMNAGAPKSYKIETDHLKDYLEGKDKQQVMENVIRYALQQSKLSGRELILPEDAEFASEIRESHRKNDVAYHAKAHIGSKEGYLFFLKAGIFFGFKKPLRLFTLDQIDSVSYTSITGRDFNMIISYRNDADAEPSEVEFLMIDQKNFAGVDSYVKKHGLNDASLAEARRAKKTGKASHQQNAEGDESELAKAEAELQDEEDEQEEDYDPDASDGDSDSSEASGDTEIDPSTQDRDLVADELGSEAEDVHDDDQADRMSLTKTFYIPTELPEAGRQTGFSETREKSGQHNQTRAKQVRTGMPSLDDEEQL